MTYRLVEGEVRLVYQGQRLVGSQPDGDSVWFKPDNPSLLSNIYGRSVRFNGGGFAQLRFEGIDALEIHFETGHQLKGPAVDARDFMLGKLGFDPDQIVYTPDGDIDVTVQSSVPVAVRASILTRAVDPYGRPVVFVFPGNAPERSGSEVFLDVQRLDTSINAQLARAGQVYPAYYAARDKNGQRVGGLPADLRNRLTQLSEQARAANEAVWSFDTSMVDTQVTGVDDLSRLAIWPKLFRRLHSFYSDRNAPHDTLNQFIAWLQADRTNRDDLVVVLSLGELLNLSDILTVTDATIRMDYPPRDLLVKPR
jgi:hypothetical protein